MFKQGILKLTQSVFRRMGLQFVGGQTPMQPSFDPSSSFMNDPLLKEQLITELADIAQKHFANRPNIPASVNINFFDQVRNFFEVYSSRPFKSNTGGSGFHNSFWLFLSARAINPDLVVESGVWKSHTTWLLEQACPKAEVLGFDINLSRREGYQGKAQFFEKDWATYDFKNIDPERSFIFFDCHVNHASRIIEASQRGFKHLLFDDNPPAHKLYSYGLPGFPTANMVWEEGEKSGSQELSWNWQGKTITCPIDKEQVFRAKKLMSQHEVFPDVGSITRYGGFSFLTYVQLTPE